MNKSNSVRYPEIITDVYLSIMFLIFPLFVGSRGYLNITEVKYNLFKWATIFYIAVMLLTLIEVSLIGKYSEIIAKLRQFSITKACVIGYAICCCISALVSEYRSKVWLGAGRYEGLGTILLYAALFFFVSYFGKFKKWYLYLFGVVVLVNTAISVMQYAGYNPLLLFPKGYTYHDAFKLYANAFLGTLGNIDILSAFLSLVIPLFYAYFILKDNSWILMFPFAAGVFLLLLSGVSAGIAGIGIGAFVTIPLIANTKRGFAKALFSIGIAALCAVIWQSISFTYENRVTQLNFRFGIIPAMLILAAFIFFMMAYAISLSEKSKLWDSQVAKKVLVACLAFAAVGGIVVIWAYPFKDTFLADAHQILHGNIDPKLGSSRIQIWQEVIKLIPKNVWFGGGPDTLVERITFSFKRYDPTLGIKIESFIDNAHNDYLNILANTGVISLVFYMAALISAAVRAVHKSISNITALVILVTLISYLTQIFFSFSICIVSPFFWIFFGLFEATLFKNNKKDVVS